MRGMDKLPTRTQTKADLHVAKWASAAACGELMRRLRAWMNGSRAASGWHTRAISIHSFSFHWVAPLQWLIFLSFPLSAARSAVCFLYALGGNYTWNYAWVVVAAVAAQNSQPRETFSLVSPPPPSRQCGFWGTSARIHKSRWNSCAGEQWAFLCSNMQLKLFTKTDSG